jgi:hypothetical protein
MRWLGVAVLVSALVAFHSAQMLSQKVIVVGSSGELRSSILNAKPGTKTLLKPGEYEGGLFFQNVKGELNNPIVISASDPTKLPVIKGGGECLHFSEVAHLEIHNLVLVGARYNGLNIDDGGSFDTPSHHIVLKNLQVRDIGPTGNCDGIKLSGVTNFRVENCTIEQWGDGGQGIDMVGCRDGIISNCTLRFEDDKGFGIQAKGGSSNIRIVRCRLEHAGA